MPVIGGALGLAVAGRRLPGARQVVEAVPVDARRLADQKLGRPLQAPDLDLLGAEGRDADLADPDRQVGDGADLVDLRRPFVDLPQVPVEREAVHGDRVDVVEHALVRQVADEAGIDRRHAAEHARKRRRSRPGSPARRRSPSRRSGSSPGRARGPNGTCCWARSRSSPLRSFACSLAPDRPRRRRPAPRRGGRRKPRPPGAARSRSRRCAASPRRRPRFGTHQLVGSSA